MAEDRVDWCDQEQDERRMVAQPHHAAYRAVEPAVEEAGHGQREYRQVEIGIEVEAIEDRVENRIRDGVGQHHRAEDESRACPRRAASAGARGIARRWSLHHLRTRRWTPTDHLRLLQDRSRG